MKFSTASTLCQELFSSFFKLFCSVIRIVFSCARCLADSLVILSRPFPFVNGFFQVFSSFSPFWQFCPPYLFLTRRAMCVLLKGCPLLYSSIPPPASVYLLYIILQTPFPWAASLAPLLLPLPRSLPNLSVRNNFFFLFINSIHPLFTHFFHLNLLFLIR